MIIFQSDDDYFFEDETRAEEHCVLANCTYSAMDLSKKEEVCNLLTEFNLLKKEVEDIKKSLPDIHE